MIKLQPQGTKLIVHPIEMKNFVTESNLESEIKIKIQELKSNKIK